jgi:hypothetical protein
VGPNGIVVHAPGLDDCARLGQAEKPVLIETLVAEPAIEAFDVGVLVRLARVDEMQPNTVGVRPGVEGPADEFGPLSVISIFGVPRVSTSRWRTSTTRRPPMEVSSSIARQARVKSSTTARSRTRRPSSRVSRRKSSDQRSLIRVGATRGAPRTTRRRCAETQCGARHGRAFHLPPRHRGPAWAEGEQMMDSINVRLILLVGAVLLLTGVGLLVYNVLGF